MGTLESYTAHLLRTWKVEVTSDLEALGLTIREVLVPRSSLARHVHERAYFCALLEGSLESDYGSRLVRYRRALTVFHPAETVHASAIGVHGARLLTVEMGSEWLLRAEVEGSLPPSPSGLSLADGGAADRLVRELRIGGPCALLAIEGLVLELLAAASRSRDRDEADQGWLERARSFIHEEATARTTLSELARRVGVSPYRLARAFRRRHGVSVGGYVRRLRVERAAEALRTDRTLKDIARSTGFADQAHLTRCFRNLQGLTPGEYRRRLRGA